MAPNGYVILSCISHAATAPDPALAVAVALCHGFTGVKVTVKHGSHPSPPEEKGHKFYAEHAEELHRLVGNDPDFQPGGSLATASGTTIGHTYPLTRGMVLYWRPPRPGERLHRATMR